MRLGLLTAAFPELTLDEIADWAATNGFEALEVACWPRSEGTSRRYAGVCHLDVDRLDPDAVAQTLQRSGLAISALAYYPNNLDPDDDVRAHAHAHLRKVILATELLGVETVGTFIGNDKDRPPPENLERFRVLWPPLVAHAGEHGVKIAIENCPMIFSYDQWPGGTNLAYSPAHWRAMFDAIPDGHFGLNLDRRT
jgi:sugar phosphate isomerase/epimerase